MKVLYIVNPISGGKDKVYFVNNIHDYCYTYGIEYDFFTPLVEMMFRLYVKKP